MLLDFLHLIFPWSDFIYLFGKTIRSISSKNWTLEPPHKWESSFEPLCHPPCHLALFQTDSLKQINAIKMFFWKWERGGERFESCVDATKAIVMKLAKFLETINWFVRSSRFLNFEANQKKRETLAIQFLLKIVFQKFFSLIIVILSFIISANFGIELFRLPKYN